MIIDFISRADWWRSKQSLDLHLFDFRSSFPHVRSKLSWTSTDNCQSTFQHSTTGGRSTLAIIRGASEENSARCEQRELHRSEWLSYYQSSETGRSTTTTDWAQSTLANILSTRRSENRWKSTRHVDLSQCLDDQLEYKRCFRTSKATHVRFENQRLNSEWTRPTSHLEHSSSHHFIRSSYFERKEMNEILSIRLRAENPWRSNEQILLLSCHSYTILFQLPFFSSSFLYIYKRSTIQSDKTSKEERNWFLFSFSTENKSLYLDPHIIVDSFDSPVNVKQSTETECETFTTGNDESDEKNANDKIWKYLPLFDGCVSILGNDSEKSSSVKLNQMEFHRHRSIYSFIRRRIGKLMSIKLWLRRRQRAERFQKRPKEVVHHQSRGVPAIVSNRSCLLWAHSDG